MYASPQEMFYSSSSSARIVGRFWGIVKQPDNIDVLLAYEVEPGTGAPDDTSSAQSLRGTRSWAVTRRWASDRSLRAWLPPLQTTGHPLRRQPRVGSRECGDSGTRWR